MKMVTRYEYRISHKRDDDGDKCPEDEGSYHATWWHSEEEHQAMQAGTAPLGECKSCEAKWKPTGKTKEEPWVDPNMEIKF